MVAHHVRPRLDAEGLGALLVDVESGKHSVPLRTAAVPRHHPRAVLGTVHQQAAARARAYVAAAVADERLHLLNAVGAEGLELVHARPSGHDQKIQPVKSAFAHHLTVQQLQLHLRRLVHEAEPFYRADAARPLVRVHANLERRLRRCDRRTRALVSCRAARPRGAPPDRGRCREQKELTYLFHCLTFLDGRPQWDDATILP